MLNEPTRLVTDHRSGMVPASVRFLRVPGPCAVDNPTPDPCRFFPHRNILRPDDQNKGHSPMHRATSQSSPLVGSLHFLLPPTVQTGSVFRYGPGTQGNPRPVGCLDRLPGVNPLSRDAPLSHIPIPSARVYEDIRQTPPQDGPPALLP